MKTSSRISEQVVKRLPRYYRCLKAFEAEGKERVCSEEISRRMQITASQVRQDFTHFGSCGMQGYGYDVHLLKERVSAMIGLTRAYHVIVVGGGNVGRSICNYQGFFREGFFVQAVFDLFPESVEVRPGIKVLSESELENYLAGHDVDIGVVAVEAEAAQATADRLIAGGVRAIWNFAPLNLQTPEGVAVENIFMSDSLFVLTYKFNQALKQESASRKGTQNNKKTSAAEKKGPGAEEDADLSD